MALWRLPTPENRCCCPECPTTADVTPPLLGRPPLFPQVIRGSDNPLARAASHGRPTQHLLAAAAYDLDVLQQLAVLERTLAGWVRHTAYGVDERWVEAAASLAPRDPQAAPELRLPPTPPPALLAPLSELQRAGLRAELAGKWKWSEGVEVSHQAGCFSPAGSPPPTILCRALLCAMR